MQNLNGFIIQSASGLLSYAQMEQVQGMDQILNTHYLHQVPHAVSLIAADRPTAMLVSQTRYY